jgi:IS5 family transposase
VGKTKRGKGTKIMAVSDSAGLPVFICAQSATPHEVTLVQETLAEIFVNEPIERLIGDNAYDSDGLDQELAEHGVEMIAPHRSNRKNRRRMGVLSAGTAVGGRLNGSSRGFKTSAA